MRSSSEVSSSHPIPRVALAIVASVALFLGLWAAPAQAAGPTVTASSAGSKTVGETTYAWGTASGFGTPVTVSTQVLINGAWSTSQKTTTSGYYTLPLTYGANTPGTYTFRVVATNGSKTATSPNFTLKRTPKPKVTASSAGSKTVGETTYAWGTASGFGTPVTVSTQVLINGKWSTSQKTTTSGYYTLPLTYGANTAGTYTFRVVATNGTKTATSPNFTLKRTPKPATGGIPDSVWKALAQCESGGNPKIVSSNGRYYGLYQFSLSTWRSVGGTGLPTEASVEEQTDRARILQARYGWGQWPACSRKLGLR